MPNLYLKTNTPNGQIFGYKLPMGGIKHVARFFPDRPTPVSDEDAKKLLGLYEQLGDWDKDKEKVRKILAEREARRRKEEEAARKGRKQVGPAVQPIHTDPKMAKRIQRTENRDFPDPADEVIPEEELNNPITNEAPVPVQEVSGGTTGMVPVGTIVKIDADTPRDHEPQPDGDQNEDPQKAPVENAKSVHQPTAGKPAADKGKDTEPKKEANSKGK